MAVLGADDVAAANKATVRRVTDAWNARDRAAFDPCYAPRITVHGRGQRETFDHDEHWDQVLGVFEVFPDLRATIRSMVAEDDRVVVRWTYEGTHEGSLRGIPPTGRRAAWDVWSEYRLADGAIVEATQVHDRVALYQQLGIDRLPPA